MEPVRQCRYSFTQRDDEWRTEYWASLALRYCPSLPLHRCKSLLEHFGSAHAAIGSCADWAEHEIAPAAAAAIRKGTWRQAARAEWDSCKEISCGVITWSDPDYPHWLRTLTDPPLVLYFLGALSLLGNVAVAVVGARECTAEGLRATVHIARGLSEAGVTVISGMARGIDRAAHLAGLQGVGKSIGVLGTGVDVVYPKSNRDLRQLMLNEGLLVSEYGPGLGGRVGSFPVRNRIISGLSRAVLVTEAAVRSGSLNTARHALEQGREVMAVPGAVSSASAKGCQELVRRGAKAVFCADDVLRELLPLLADHVATAVQQRDLARFAPKKSSLEPPQPEDLMIGLGEAPGALPWEVACPAARTRSVPEDIQPGAGDSGSATGGKIKKTSVRSAPAPTQLTDEKAVVSEQLTDVAAGLNPGERAIYTALSTGASLHIDDICERLGQSAASVSRQLLMLEVHGYVQRLPGMIYTVRK